MVYFDSKLNDRLPLTIGFLLEKVQNYHKRLGYLLDWKSEVIGDRDDYAAIILVIHLHWKDDIGLPKSVLVKGPSSIPSDDEKCIRWFTTSQHNELAAYQFLQSIDGLPIARMYHSEKIENGNTGYMIMESFVENGCNVKPPDELSFEQITSTVDALAKIHAHSLKSNSWESTLKISSDDVYEAWSQLINVSQGVQNLLMNAKPEYFHRIIGKISYLFDARKICEIVLFSHKILGIPPVFVHGDLSVGNVILEKICQQSTDPIPGNNPVAIIDWHLAHSGNCCEDIACLLATSCSGQLRRQKTNHLLKFYHDKLTQYMGHMPMPISLHQVVKAYKNMLPYGLMMLMFKLPFWIKDDDGVDKERKVEKTLLNTKFLIEDVISMRKEYER